MPERQLVLRVIKKDFDIQTFRSGGPGGQHQNKTDSGVRIVHRASGAVGESRSERSQLTNKKIALQRLATSSTFRLWVNRQLEDQTEVKRQIEHRVKETMKPENLIVEVQTDTGQWVKEPG